MPIALISRLEFITVGNLRFQEGFKSLPVVVGCPARSRNDNEGDQIEEIGIRFPLVDLQKGIDAHDQEEQETVRRRGLKMTHRIDGIRRAQTVELNIGNNEAVLICGRKTKHLEPVVGICHNSCFLVGGNSCRDKIYSVQFKMRFDFQCSTQMAKMNRVEGAAKKPDLFQYVLALDSMYTN